MVPLTTRVLVGLIGQRNVMREKNLDYITWKSPKPTMKAPHNWNIRFASGSKRGIDDIVELSNC